MVGAAPTRPLHPLILNIDVPPEPARDERPPSPAVRLTRRQLASTDARSDWNRVLLYVWPVVDLPLDEFDDVVGRLAPRTEGLGIEQVLVQFRAAPALFDGATSEPREMLLRLSRPPGAGLTVRLTAPLKLPTT